MAQPARAADAPRPDAPVLDETLLAEALEGLGASPKTLHPKWFYDSRGSALFERITELPEYYLTRAELSVLRAHAGALAAHVPEGAALIELGSGASTKTRILLDGVAQIAAYVPVDVSEDFLHEVAADIDRAYPALEVAPVTGDFLAPLPLPDSVAERPKAGFFPGSTLGNLEAGEARALLARARAWPGVACFVLGVDLVKDPEVLIRSYDDAEGVTAAFNRNILHRLNRDAGAGFDPDAFAHEARWNEDEARVEMHLVSRTDQQVPLGGETIRFTRGESIHTESSRKYTRDRLEALAEQGGWRLGEFLTDEDDRFGVALLLPDT